jgi:hypothetical protein
MRTVQPARLNSSANARITSRTVLFNVACIKCSLSAFLRTYSQMHVRMDTIDTPEEAQITPLAYQEGEKAENLAKLRYIASLVIRAFYSFPPSRRCTAVICVNRPHIYKTRRRRKLLAG